MSSSDHFQRINPRNYARATLPPRSEYLTDVAGDFAHVISTDGYLGHSHLNISQILKIYNGYFVSNEINSPQPFYYFSATESFMAWNKMGSFYYNKWTFLDSCVYSLDIAPRSSQSSAG